MGWEGSCGGAGIPWRCQGFAVRALLCWGSVTRWTHGSQRSFPSSGIPWAKRARAAGSPQRMCPTARPGTGCVSVLAVPHVKVGSVVPFHQPRPIPCGCLGSFPVDSQGCLGGRSLPTERIFLQKRLSSTLHSPQTRPDPGTCFLPHPGILSDPTSLTLPWFLLKYQTKCIKNRCTSCFPLLLFQNTLLKGARSLLTPHSFKCKGRKQPIADTKLKSRTSPASQV